MTILPAVLVSFLGAVAAGEVVAAEPRVLTAADLKPIRLGDDTEGVRALIARGRWTEAAALASGGEPGPRLVRGWLLGKGGQPSGALAALKGLEADLPLLAGMIKVLRANAQLALDQPAQALVEVEGLPPEAPGGREARRIRARALREAGRTAEARTAYEALVATKDREEIAGGLLGLARLEVEAGHPEKAILHLRRIDLESPLHWAGGAARELAAKLVAANPKLTKAWADRGPQQLLARGEMLQEAHRNREAVETLEPLVEAKLSPAERCRLRYALGRALRKLRRWTTAKPHLVDATESCARAGHELAAPALYQAGAAAERLNFEDEAANHYQRLLEEHPDHKLADDAGFFLVRHELEDKEDFAAARKRVGQLVERFPRGDLVEEAVFFVALHAMLAKHPEDARAVLALVDRLPPADYRDHDAGRTVYWRARLDLEAGREAEAKKGFRTVLATWPFSWYALHAYNRLRELDVNEARAFAAQTLAADTALPTLPAGDAEEWRLTVPAGLDPVAFDRALLLARLGLADPAWEALRDAGAGLNASGDVLWLAAWVLDQAGAWRISHDLPRRKLLHFRRMPPAGATRKHWEVAYPTPFADLVKKASKASGVDRHFLWAIMREESGFNVGIESSANAIGLMQLILPTAQRMAKKAEEPITRERLTDPDLNVPLGARYLAYVDHRIGGSLAILPSGYNAGEGAVLRWLKQRPDLPLDLFVEAIPFEEARWYTKRVVSSWAVYRYLYGGKLEDPYPVVGPALPKRK